MPEQNSGCSSDNIETTLDDEAWQPVEDQCASTPPAVAGTFTPQEALDAFDGLELNGTWTLTVNDNAGQDTGTLVQWCLEPSIVWPPHIFSDGFETGDTTAWLRRP